MKKQEIPAELRWLVENASPGKLITYAAGDGKLATILEHHSAHPSVRRYLNARHVFQLAPNNSTAKAYARSAKSYMVTALLNLYGTQRLGILDPKAKGDRVDKLEHRLDTFRQAHKRERAQVAELTRERDAFAAQLAKVEQTATTLLRERDEARASDLETGEVLAQTHAAHVKGQSEVARLTEALAAAEQQAVRIEEKASSHFARAEAAESECAALRAEVAAEEKAAAAMVKGARDAAEFHLRNSDAEYDRRIAAESSLAAANALLGRARRLVTADTLQDDIDAHLAAQPATAPARDEACKRCPGLLEQRDEARKTVEELAAKLGFAVEW